MRQITRKEFEDILNDKDNKKAFKESNVERTLFVVPNAGPFWYSYIVKYKNGRLMDIYKEWNINEDNNTRKWMKVYKAAHLAYNEGLKKLRSDYNEATSGI
jgi:hypothetical protein